MLTGLTTDELATARLSGTYSDLVAGPQKDATFPSTPSGISCANLTADQKTLVLEAIKTYVNDIASADDIITKYTSELNDTYIAYSGTAGVVTRNDLCAYSGPSVWISIHARTALYYSGTHPHSVWRDKTSDYGGN